MAVVQGTSKLVIDVASALASVLGGAGGEPSLQLSSMALIGSFLYGYRLRNTLSTEHPNRIQSSLQRPETKPCFCRGTA